MKDPVRGDKRTPRLRHAIVASLTALFMLQLAAPAFAQGGTTFTCRASLVRITPEGLLAPLGVIEPVVANEDGEDCTTENAGLLNNFALPAGLGTVSALYANTSDVNGGNAAAGVLNLTLTLPGAPVINAQVLTADAQSRCQGNAAAFTGDSHVVHVAIGGTVIEIPPDKNTGLTVGPVSVVLREEIETEDTITERALHVRVAGVADVVIAEAIADVHGGCGGVQPPPPPPPGPPPPPPPDGGDPECSDEIDNDDDGAIDYGDGMPNGDPECESPVDDDESNGGNSECDDGMNNDPDDTENDGAELIDFPWDPDCDSPSDDSEDGGNGPDVADENGFKTGGGGVDEEDGEDSVFPPVTGTDRAHAAGPLPCDVGGKPNANQNIRVFTESGDRFRFKLEELVYARCVDGPGAGPERPSADWNYWAGWGTGDLTTTGGMTMPDVQAQFWFRDSGEGGGHGGTDYLAFRVPMPQNPPGGSENLLMAVPYAFGTLDSGNYQAHGGGGGGGDAAGTSGKGKRRR